MKCKKCDTEMIQCKQGITIGSLKKGVKLSLYRCPKCNCLQRRKEKAKF